MITSGCPHLNIGSQTMTERIKIITCQALHIILPFKQKHIEGGINTEIEIINTPWECPILEEKRKNGELPKVMMSVIPVK
jgi:hypothetical protein